MTALVAITCTIIASAVHVALYYTSAFHEGCHLTMPNAGSLVSLMNPYKAIY